MLRMMTSRMMMLRGRTDPRPRTTLCASLRNRNALGHVRKTTVVCKLSEKCPTPEPRHTLCASLRSRNALQHVTRANLYGDLK